MKLILVRGLPGTGKTTFAKQFNCLHLENDQFSMIDGEYQWTNDAYKERAAMCKGMTEQALGLGCDVCVSNTFLTNKSIDRYIRMGRHYRADIEIYCTPNIMYSNTHNVPEKTLKQMKESMEIVKNEKYICEGKRICTIDSFEHVFDTIPFLKQFMVKNDNMYFYDYMKINEYMGFEYIKAEGPIVPKPLNKVIEEGEKRGDIV